MKNYFNERERTNHIILMCTEYNVKEFAESNALTDNEKRILNKISKLANEFNSSVFDRFGEPYKRKIVGTLNCNNLRLVGKYTPVADCISYCASEDIEPKVKELIAINCMGCEKCNYKDCAIYSMAVTCGINGSSESGCPYLMEI